MNALQQHEYKLQQLTSVGLDAHIAKHREYALSLVGTTASSELYEEQVNNLTNGCPLCRPPYDASWLEEEGEYND